jgi:hypothetical protein
MEIKFENDAIEELVDSLDWPDITTQLDREGYALLPGLFGTDNTLTQFLADRDVDIDVGIDVASAWRDAFYRRLAPIANRWNQSMESSDRYPATLDAFQRQNRQAGLFLDRAQAHLSVSRLLEGEYQALHQMPATEGDQTFPLQLVALLSEPGRDFSGGEFVMTEQRPRMQTRPMVLPLDKGDAAIIAVAQRPFKGSKGYYRVNLKHAISRVHGGERIGVEVLFHDPA